MLSQTAEYALRSVLHLAQEADGEPVSVDAIAEALSLPRNYLSKTLHTLAKAGMLVSSRGPGGGFQLAGSAERLSLFEVVSTFDDLDSRRQCLLGRSRCSDESPCPAHERWKSVAERVATFFRETTVADLIGKDAASVGAGVLEGREP